MHRPHSLSCLQGYIYSIRNNSSLAMTVTEPSWPYADSNTVAWVWKLKMVLLYLDIQLTTPSPVWTTLCYVI